MNPTKMTRLMVHLLLLTLAIFHKKRLSAFIITFGRSQAYGVKSIGGTGMLSRHDWVEVRGAAAGGAVARERRRREAHGRGVGALPQKILKN